MIMKFTIRALGLGNYTFIIINAYYGAIVIFLKAKPYGDSLYPLTKVIIEANCHPKNSKSSHQAQTLARP